MVNKNAVSAPRPAPRAPRGGGPNRRRHTARSPRARPEASRVRSEMYSSRAMAEGQGGSPSPRRLGLRLMPALASRPAASAPPPGRRESQSESRDPATADPPGRTAAPGAAQDGRRPEHGDRREARTDMSVILSDRPKQPRVRNLLIMIYVSARYFKKINSKIHSSVSLSGWHATVLFVFPQLRDDRERYNRV